MSVSEMLQTITNNVPLVYNAGYEKGKAEGGSLEDNPLYYMNVYSFQWSGVTFPDGFDFVLNVRQKPSDMNAMLSGAKGLKSVKLICDVEGTVNYSQMIRETSTEILDLSEFKPTPSNISNFCYICENLVKILGKIDMSACTTAANPFARCYVLQDIEFVPNTINISISFDWCTELNKNTLTSIVNGLSNTATGLTVALSLTAVNTAFEGGKDGTEWQTLIAERPNWNIAYA